MHLAWQMKFCPVLLKKEVERGAEREKEETDDDEKTSTKDRQHRPRIRRLRRIYNDLDLNSPISSDVK
jgi:hypothetical protein